MSEAELMNARRQLVQAAAVIGVAASREATLEARNLEYAIDRLMQSMDAWLSGKARDEQ